MLIMICKREIIYLLLIEQQAVNCLKLFSSFIEYYDK